jgi:predicted nucleic-acid-binding protein
MPSLDTNVLVRYIVEDDAAQLATARRLIGRCLREGLTLFVPVTVILELEWVLRKSYGFAKDDVLRAMANLFSAAELSLESEHALEVALALYRQGAADFADCLHVAQAAQAGEQPLWTFDKAAAKVSGARLPWKRQLTARLSS